MSKYKLVHNRPNCIGCGACVSTCGKFWEMDVDGKSRLRSKKQDGSEELEIDEKDFECNMEAARICPVNVIHIIDLKTNKKLI